MHQALFENFHVDPQKKSELDPYIYTKQEAQRAIYSAPEYNVQPFRRIYQF